MSMCVYVSVNTRGKRRRDERDKQISIECFSWLAAQISCRAEQKKKPLTIHKTAAVFFLSFSFTSVDTFSPLLKKKNYLELYRLRGDGSCPFCSGSQVWADNCRVCAAETDDYRLYCLSQAQSTLIQQSHLSLIYESRSLSSHTPLYHTSYAHMLAFGYFFSFPHVPHCRVSTSCHLTVQWKERIELLQVPPLRRIRLFMMIMAA